MNIFIEPRKQGWCNQQFAGTP